VLTANRGLAGAFNSNILREARGLLSRLATEKIETELHVVGRKGLGYFRFTGREVASSRTDIGDRPSVADAGQLVDGLMDRFASGALDAVYVVSAKFQSALSTPPRTERILPVTPPERKGPGRDYLLFPSAEAILTELLPAYVRNTVYRALVENEAGFQGAQRTAMKNATDNATDMLGTLRRTYNRARQANITQEISEIVGGAAALE
jgi:F-type H+-transporting ATPase subunit gamma